MPWMNPSAMLPPAVFSGNTPLGARKLSSVKNSPAVSQRAEAVVDECGDGRAGEVLVDLGDVDVGGPVPGLGPQPPGDAFEARRPVRLDALVTVTPRGTGTVRRRQHVRRAVREIAGPLGRGEDERHRSVVLPRAVEQVERLGDPARFVVDLLVERASCA